MLLTKANESGACERGQQPEEATFQASTQPTSRTLPPFLPPFLSLLSQQFGLRQPNFCLFTPANEDALLLVFAMVFSFFLVLVSFAASWQFNFAGVSTNIERTRERESEKHKATSQIILNEEQTQAKHFYAIDWEEIRQKIVLKIRPKTVS